MSNKEGRQDKKEQFVTQQKSSNTVKTFGLLGVLIVAAVAGWLFLGQGPTDGFASVKSENGFINLDLTEIQDGSAHYFKYSTNKGDIKFFVVKSVDGVMRAAFDACDVCYRDKKGYSQQGDFMVCNNCGQQFRTDLVNEVKGGCNPAPLARSVQGSKLIIAQADILRGGWYFGI